MKMQLPQGLLKKHFFSGILVVIPLGAIVWISVAVIRSLGSLHLILPVQWRPETVFEDPTLAGFINFAITVGLTIALAFGVSFLGWASKQYLGKKFLNLLTELIHHIPVIRGVYSALDQLLRALTSGDGQQFNRVVYIEYPRKGLWAIAFVTGEARGPAVPPHHLNIYVPTTPNPTSGFHLIVPESEVRESHLTVENAFKTLLSLGIAQ